MNMFIDPHIGPVLTVIFIICCSAGAFFIIMEAWRDNKKKPLMEMPPSRYESYIIMEDGTVLYPIAVVDHIDEQA